MSYGYQYGYAAPYAQRRSAPAALHVVAVIQYLGGLLMLAVAAFFAMITFGDYRLDLGTDIPYTATGNIDGGDAIALAVAGIFGFIGLTAIVLGRKVQV